MTIEQFRDRFVEKGLTLGSVESFTGGLFARTITEVSGASKYYKGGLVTYATEEKQRILKIKPDLIEQYGVVSKEIAFQMANNAKHLLNVDVCVSFTGNAGPDAMEGKPVGEVYIGVIYQGVCEVFKKNLKGNRGEIQQQAVEFALEKIWNKI